MEYFTSNFSTIISQTGEHIAVSLMSLLIASVIGIGFGYLASGHPYWEKVSTAGFQVLRVIPSLAVLVILIPVMGTGKAPAVTALTVLAIPPILLNTTVGFIEVPDYMIEAGRGIGMNGRQILLRVRIPAALPMIFAGIRTALVEVFASATLAAKIGAGGLGEIIFTGLGLNRMDIVFVGGVLVALLSLLAGLIFDLLTRKTLKYKYL